MSTPAQRPKSPEEALQLGYKLVGDVDTLLKKHHKLSEDEFPARRSALIASLGGAVGCTPPPPDNICLDTIMDGHHIIGYCVPGQGCITYQAP